MAGNRKARPTFQFDNDKTTLIRRWPSVRDAAEVLTAEENRLKELAAQGEPFLKTASSQVANRIFASIRMTSKCYDSYWSFTDSIIPKPKSSYF